MLHGMQPLPAVNGPPGGELRLNVDTEGRIAGVGVGLDYSNRSWELQNQLLKPACLEALRNDAMTVNAPELDATFWLPCNMEPRNSLERLARHIFRAHTQGVKFDPQRSGAEWWVQVRKHRAGAVDADDANADMKRSQLMAEESIRFHWDKDETLGAAFQVYLHPQLSTVTYLTDSGAPTVVLPVRFTRDGKLDLAPDSPNSRSGIAHLSFPRSGKHFAFDGRYLHAAPAQLNPLNIAGVAGAVGDVRMRVTVSVNVWLHHSPVAIAPLPVPISQRLTNLAEQQMFETMWLAGVTPAPTMQTVLAVGPTIPRTIQHQFPLRLGADICVRMHVPPIETIMLNQLTQLEPAATTLRLMDGQSTTFQLQFGAAHQAKVCILPPLAAAAAARTNAALATLGKPVTVTATPIGSAPPAATVTATAIASALAAAAGAAASVAPPIPQGPSPEALSQMHLRTYGSIAAGMASGDLAFLNKQGKIYDSCGKKIADSLGKYHEQLLNPPLPAVVLAASAAAAAAAADKPKKKRKPGSGRPKGSKDKRPRRRRKKSEFAAMRALVSRTVQTVTGGADMGGGMHPGVPPGVHHQQMKLPHQGVGVGVHPRVSAFASNVAQAVAAGNVGAGVPGMSPAVAAAVAAAVGPGVPPGVPPAVAAAMGHAAMGGVPHQGL